LDLTERALRASQLAAMPTRRRIARSLRGVVKAAGQPTGSMGDAVWWIADGLQL
jgi:hypothetical protein